MTAVLFCMAMIIEIVYVFMSPVPKELENKYLLIGTAFICAADFTYHIDYTTIKMYECTKTFEIKPPADSECGSMLVHKGTLWYAVESGRERTTLTDSRIKLVLSDRLFKSHFVRWG